MTFFNPLTGAILPSIQAQGQAAASDKARSVRKAQVSSKNVAADGDRFEHEVESADALRPVHDEQDARRQSPERHHHNSSNGASDGKRSAEGLDGQDHIDVTA